MTQPDLSYVDALVERIGCGPESVIPILQAIQERRRYLPPEALRRVCEITEITPAMIEGVSTFYSQFRHTPAGEHTIRVCIGTACHVKGAGVVHDAFCRHLEIPEGRDTDADRRFTVQKVACLGCCMLAPAVQIGDVTFGHLTAETVPQVLRDFLKLQELRGSEGERREARSVGPVGDDSPGEIRISMDTCCMARGSIAVYEAIRRASQRARSGARVKVVGCAGMSYMEPLVEVALPGEPVAVYSSVLPEDAEALVARHFRTRSLVQKVRLSASKLLDSLLTDAPRHSLERYSPDTPGGKVHAFRDPQVRIATEHSGHTQPTDLDEYLANNGFTALERCLREMSPDEIIEHVRRSGLRGRGGAGYHTGRKWAQVRSAASDARYVICNGDEGDPGAFMDRMLLESHPYRVIEGLAIAARAVGATEGYFYVRDEYPLAVRRIGEAIEQCERRGFLGNGADDGGPGLKLHVFRGAGAFVCGEETALLASIEGRRGTPRKRPPYPAECGLYGRPTLINNVETLSLVPWIMRNPPERFAELGAAESRGTKVFALAGKVVRGGLIEVPMGMTLREIVEEIGGGVADGREFKAVQVGGPSGGCVPASLCDAPVDYEALAEVGAIMGSGGLVVLDEDDCMVDIARYFLQFTQDQSCGKCTFCRVGTRVMLEILDRLCAGEGRHGDLDRLEQLAYRVKRGSLCGLGRTAPNPVLSTLRHFRDEYEAHIEGRCPAGTCKLLVRYAITDDCIGCTRCAQHCPADAIVAKPHEKHEIDADKCVRCGTCLTVCPVEAIRVE